VAAKLKRSFLVESWNEVHSFPCDFQGTDKIGVRVSVICACIFINTVFNGTQITRDGSHIKQMHG